LGKSKDDFDNVNLICVSENVSHMTKTLPLLLAALIVSSISLAQHSEHWCYTDEMHKAEEAKNPEAFKELESKLDHFIAAYHPDAANKKSVDDGRTFYIPVVFHFFHQETQPDRFFGRTQAEAVINRLNQDFNRDNPDSNLIQDYYSGFRRGRANIQFLIAEVDPDGEPTQGINYVETEKTNANRRSTDNEVKYLSYWPSDRYLNFWIVETLSQDGVLAFATLPEFKASGGTRASEDGVIGLLSLYRTTIGDPFYRHALSHEVGHWLGLRHPFQGDGDSEDGCSELPCKFGGDKICDIPQVDRSRNNECTANQTTCPNETRIDNRTNIMDYRSCPQMFSRDQVIRMRGTLFGHRSYLVSWENLQYTGISDRINDKGTAAKTSVYPNPFSDRIIFDIELQKDAQACINIKDLLGRAAYQDCKKKLYEGVNHIELSASELNLPSAGVYFLEIKLEDATIVKRIQYTPNN